MINVTETGMSRRDFVAGSAVAVGAVAATAATAQVALAEPDSSGRKAILFDGSACVGCHYCEGACSKANALGAAVSFDVAALDGTVYPKGLLPYESVRASAALPPVTVDDRDAGRWLRVVEVAAGKSAVQVRHSCMHCGLCAEVCPSGAIEWRDDGIVAVDSSRCFGCYYCYQACPFDVPRYPERGAEGGRGMVKCSMCAGIVDEGGVPACVEACPAGALKFGTFEEMKAAGEAAAAASGGELYGAAELGGMGVMYVLPAGAKASGLPRL